MSLDFLRIYRRSWVAADALAAVTLLVIAVPEQLATSRLAEMPPITGFYAFIAGTVLFAVVGTNPQVSVGADSTIAPLFAVGVAGLAAPGSPHYQQLVSVLAVMVGLILAFVWLLRLGWISELLSTPIITGFLGGVAVIIVVHQLPDLLGVASVRGSTVERISSAISHLGQVSPWSLAIGLGVFVLVLVTERLDRRLPGALVGLAAAAALVAGLQLRRHGVDVLGHIARVGPRLGLPGLSLTAVGQLAPLAGIVALVVVLQSAATTRAFAEQGHFDVDVGRDLLGVGAGGIAAGLTGAFPVDASPPRTAAVAAAGGRTQLAGLLAAAAVAAVVPVAGVLRYVPLPALAGVLLFVAVRLFRVRDLIAIARFDLIELGLAIVTLLAVALIGVEQGLLVAIGLAILERTRLTARPSLHVLGRIPETTSWVPLGSAQHPVRVPGVLVVVFATPLWYANAAHFRDELEAARNRVAGPLRLVVLDALGMSDLDFTGARALEQVLDSLERDHVAFAVARAGRHLRENLERGGLLARIGEDHLFSAVDEAVRTLSTPSAAPAGPPITGDH
jgi:high affinity sulfate transporter 1